MINIYCIKYEEKIIYVGQTKFDIKKRFVDHKSRSKTEHKRKSKLYNFLRKYANKDYSNFSIELIETVSVNQSDEKEKYWIEYYDTLNNGCNIAIGGKVNRGYKMTKEQKNKMSVLRKKEWAEGKNPLSKWNGTEEQKKYLSDLFKNQRKTIKWGDQISIAKSKGPYNIEIDGQKTTYFFGLNKIAKILNVNNASLKISLKENRYVNSKGKKIKVTK